MFRANKNIIFNISNAIDVNVGNNTIFTESIKVKQGPEIQYIIPEKTAAGLPTDFLLGIDAEGKNISKIMWFFGDGINVTTSNTRTSHAYNATGLYNLKVDLYVSGDNESASSKVFVISAGSPKEILNSSIVPWKKSNFLLVP